MVESTKPPADLSLGNDKANCKVSFYKGDSGSTMMEVSEINGISGNSNPVFAGIHPAKMEIPLPLAEHQSLVFHNLDGVEALQIKGSHAPTFIPCLADQLENLCAHLGKPTPIPTA